MSAAASSSIPPFGSSFGSSTTNCAVCPTKRRPALLSTVAFTARTMAMRSRLSWSTLPFEFLRTFARRWTSTMVSAGVTRMPVNA
ncbi:hypothetical protein FrEUN1fDRAFT_2235 [Parafrankia sp. EUN1f]|nr:hypothetical protein FrEUN1fDRAFT_2235 [Parafrankia sp. EUN1f]